MYMTALEDDIKRQVETEITSCKQCKKCLLVCPLPESKEIDIFQLNLEIMSDKPSKEMLNFAFLCFSCGACNTSCPEYLRRDHHMMYLRSKGKLPKGYNNLLHWRGKRLGLVDSNLYRLKSLKDKPDEGIAKYLEKTEFKETDLFFYFACYAFSPSDIPKKTLAIADYIGLDYEVIAGYSHCCGWPHFLAGDFERAEPLFIDLFNTLSNSRAKKVVTGCAECYKALLFIKDRYAGEFKVLTTPEWLAENLKKLKLKKTDAKVTFHDACQLSRLEEEGRIPRKLINKLFTLVEMESNKKNTLCCGGMRAAHEIRGLNRLRMKRLEDAKKTETEVMITECVTCFEKYHPLAKDVQVKDLTEAIHDNLMGENSPS
jgi:Fe-S oxidoreductase